MSVLNGTKPPAVTDNPEILIKRIEIDVDEGLEYIEGTVTYIPVLRGILGSEESRSKRFPVTTPFVDVLEAIPTVFLDWTPVRRKR